MNRKSYLLYILSTLLVITFFMSCSKKSNSTSTTAAQTASVEMNFLDGSGLHAVPAPYAMVQLYKTHDEQINKTNPVTSMLTCDNKGYITINNLEAINYFFNAYSSDMTKSNATTSDQTNTLVAGQVTKLTLVVK